MSKKSVEMNSNLVKFYFESIGDGQYKCKCGKVRKQKDKTGLSNLINHIKVEHTDYSSEFAAASIECNSSQTKIDSFLCPKSKNIYSWIEWIVMECRELNFCEKDLVRKYTHLSPICRNTLVKYIDLLTKEVERQVTKVLPTKFGLVFDGWSQHSVHFLAVFAVFGSKDDQNKILLALSPFVDESDFSADSHIDFIRSVLTDVYHVSLDNVSFLVGDNCAVNKSIAQKLGVPMVGCNSHRLNLAIQQHIKESKNSSTIEKIHQLMKVMKTLKGSGKLRKLTHLSAITMCNTRWSSAYDMINRYLELIELPLHEEEIFVNFLLSPAENLAVRDLYDELKRFNSVSLALQKDETNLATVRILFDALIDKQPSLSKYLSSESSIVCSPAFESGVCKFVAGKFNACASDEEKAALSIFSRQASNSSRHAVSSDDFATSVIKYQKLNETESDIDLPFIPPTSNMCERLFSMVGHVFSDSRSSLQPTMLESLVFLKLNKSLWDAGTVQKIVN